MMDKERKERMKRREVMRKRYQTRGVGKHTIRAGKAIFVFRSYVAMMIAGALLIVSVLKTETSEAICEQVKETIAYQMPIGTLAAFKEQIAELIDNTTDMIPVFRVEGVEGIDNVDDDTGGMNGGHKKDEQSVSYRPDLEGSP